MQINWIALQGNQTGSAAIDSYNVQWDQGTDSVTWIDLAGDGVIHSFSTSTTLQLTNNVVAGKVYNIRVRAHNAIGWSVWSSPLVIKASGVPSIPLPPTTSNNNAYILVQWVYPVDGFEVIDQYRI